MTAFGPTKKLDRVVGILRRASEGRPTLPGPEGKDEQIGALRFACEYAIAQLEDIRKAVASLEEDMCGACHAEPSDDEDGLCDECRTASREYRRELMEGR